MRVLLLHNIINPHMTKVFERLGATHGIDLRVAYFAASEGDRVWTNAAQSELRSDVLQSRQVNFSFAWDYLSFHFNPGLRRWLREVEWDVLINAGWASWPNWQAFMECLRQRKPHVLWAGSTVYEKSWRRTVTLPFVRYMVRRSSACVAYGTSSAEYLRRLGADRNVLPSFHCVDNERFLADLSRSMPLRGDLKEQIGISGKRVILFVGRLIERKGLELLIDAFKSLDAHFPECVLLIAGDGPIRKKLEFQAGALKGSRIIFLGNVQLENLPAYYGIADLFVLPSLEEVWGLVINEAALAALPVVVTSICGAAADLVQDGSSGYIVPPGNQLALQEAISRILADPEHAKRMGEQSRRLVERCSPSGVAATMARAVWLAAGPKHSMQSSTEKRETSP